VAKYTRVEITALKDGVRIVTARKKIAYLPNPGLNDTGYPEGQAKEDEQEHAIILKRDQEIAIDLKDDQMSGILAAVADGSIQAFTVDATGKLNAVVAAPVVAPAKPAEAARK
jgi:hypothetical protein